MFSLNSNAFIGETASSLLFIIVVAFTDTALWYILLKVGEVVIALPTIELS